MGKPLTQDRLPPGRTEYVPTDCPSCPLGEIWRGFVYCRNYKMSSMIDHPSLKWLLRLEKKFEKIHIGASVIVTDAHLKQLFQALAGGDHNHFKTLQEIIADLEAQ